MHIDQYGNATDGSTEAQCEQNPQVIDASKANHNVTDHGNLRSWSIPALRWLLEKMHGVENMQPITRAERDRSEWIRVEIQRREAMRDQWALEVMTRHWAGTAGTTHERMSAVLRELKAQGWTK